MKMTDEYKPIISELIGSTPVLEWKIYNVLIGVL